MNTAWGFVVLAVITAALLYWAAGHSVVRRGLLPAPDSALPWRPIQIADVQEGGSSSVLIRDDTYSLDFDFNLAATLAFPYVQSGFAFDDYANPSHFSDWSSYSTVRLRVKCNPRNVLAIVLYTFDEIVTDPSIFSSYRPSTVFFSCEDTLTDVDIDLLHLSTPEWWLQRYGFEFSDRNYQLSKVLSFTIANSFQSPKETLSNVKIVATTLLGRDWRSLYITCTLVLGCWVLFTLWFLRRHLKALIDGIKKKSKIAPPLALHHKLSIDSKKDKEQSAVLRFMATEYTNPELSLDLVVSSLGINRTKINAILKDETGLTFSTYLNKLRLTEAARLLAEQDVGVAEIAYAVGYNNASYFNKVFKQEHGCTPKAFKQRVGTFDSA